MGVPGAILSGYFSADKLLTEWLNYDFIFILLIY
jgi:hypothetical protein